MAKTDLKRRIKRTILTLPFLNKAKLLIDFLDDVQSHLFLRKIEKFLLSPHLEFIAAQQLHYELHADRKSDEELANILLMTIDKATDFEKPELLSRLFCSYLIGIISRDELLMLIHITNISFSMDLKLFLQSNGSTESQDNHMLSRLSSAGLYSTKISAKTGGSSIYYSLTPLGESFLKAAEQYPTFLK